jgi:hypothetical protein
VVLDGPLVFTCKSVTFGAVSNSRSSLAGFFHRAIAECERQSAGWGRRNDIEVAGREYL